MIKKVEETQPLEIPKSSQPLSAKNKLFFGIFCWGVQSWGQADNFKTLGYDQKHKDAKKAMYTGLFIYGFIITGVVLFILFKKRGVA